MKCLRCGWEMGDDAIKCKHCHHYYDNNLRKASATINYFNSEEDRKKSKKRFITGLVVIIIFFTVSLLSIFWKDIRQVVKPQWGLNKCSLVCEENVRSVIFNRCTCTNGKVIILSK